MKKRLLPLASITLALALLLTAAWVIYVGMGKSEADRLCRERFCYACHGDGFTEPLACLKSREAGSPMTPLIIEALRREHPGIAEEQLQVIAEEIARRQLPAIDARQQSRRGERLYIAKCAACHGSKGEGKPGQYPPLAGSEWLTDEPSRLPEILRLGLRGPISVKGEPWDEIMLPPGLSDSDHEPVIQYLRERFARP